MIFKTDVDLHKVFDFVLWEGFKRCIYCAIKSVQWEKELGIWVRWHGSDLYIQMIKNIYSLKLERDLIYEKERRNVKLSFIDLHFLLYFLDPMFIKNLWRQVFITCLLLPRFPLLGQVYGNVSCQGGLHKESRNTYKHVSEKCGKNLEQNG